MIRVLWAQLRILGLAAGATLIGDKILAPKGIIRWHDGLYDAELDVVSGHDQVIRGLWKHDGTPYTGWTGSAVSGSVDTRSCQAHPDSEVEIAAMLVNVGLAEMPSPASPFAVVVRSGVHSIEEMRKLSE